MELKEIKERIKELNVGYPNDRIVVQRYNNVIRIVIVSIVGETQTYSYRDRELTYVEGECYLSDIKDMKKLFYDKNN